MYYYIFIFIKQVISRLFCYKFQYFLQSNTDFNGLSPNGEIHGFDPCIVGSNPTSPACLYHRQRLFVSFLYLFLRELRGSICESSGTVRFRRARNRLTLRPAYKVATDHRVYMWAMGTARVFKYENAVMRGIKLYVHP